MKKHLHIILLSVFFCFLFQVITCAASGDMLSKLNNIDLLFKDGKYDKCIELSDGILKNDGTFMEAYKFKALSHFKQKKYDAAIVVLEEQLRLNPNNELALYNAACLYSLTENMKKAEDCLAKLMELNITNKVGIKKDADFDNIKDSIIYKNISGITVRVGGKVLFFDVPAITINDRTMLPMRSVFEALGAQITWDEKTQTVTAVKSNTVVKVTIGSWVINIDGAEKQIDTPATIKDDRTLVPVRFVSEALGADVIWNGKDEIVEILTKAPQGNGKYDDVKKQLDNMIDISAVSGLFSEPYNLGREGKMLVIAKDKKALELMGSLSDEQRAKYMCEKTEQSAKSLSGCGAIYMEFIFEGKAYYCGKYAKENKASLVYYENGLVVNTVLQDRDGLNYKDYYTGGDNAAK